MDDTKAELWRSSRNWKLPGFRKENSLSVIIADKKYLILRARHLLLVLVLFSYTTVATQAQGTFTTTGDTSAATAQVARMGAQILADRPALWPETVRALLVHSAQWTRAMHKHLPAMPSQTGSSRSALTCATRNRSYPLAL